MSKAQLKLVRSAGGPPEAGSHLAALIEPLAGAEREAVESAFDLALSRARVVELPGGEGTIGHVLGTAGLVAGLLRDGEAIAAALLAPLAASDEKLPDEARQRCGATVADLVEGVVRMQQIPALSARRPAAGAGDEAAQLEALRKMLLAMVQDIRVVLIKLAEHVQELRYAVKSDDERAKRQAALLTFDLYAPLANRLGVWQLKWEMEDLAFRVLEPQTYQRIARLLDGKRPDRERYIENVTALLKGELARAGIAAEVAGRPKHIYSIYKKLNLKDLEFEALYDVRAVRILVRDVKDCYASLGLVHNLWTPIPGEFDDYIAKPKSNQYRSLHTAVIGPGDKALEVQIRTHDMHHHSELGVAAHWRYKEGSRGEAGYDRKIAWLRQILEWKGETGEAGDLAERFRTGLFEDAIYVLTPQGRVISLARGSTPVDFAYHVHTELGHRCRGAKVDGAMVPLNTPLENGQRIEILPARQGGPSRDWLNPELGFVKSPTARARIRQWFNRQHTEEAVAQGRLVVEKELRRRGMTALGLDKLAAHLGFAKPEELLAEVGRGEIRSGQLDHALAALDPRAPTTPVLSDMLPSPAVRRRAAPRGKGGVLIVGVDRLLTVPAKCCKPAPPDAIVGFITRGRGVTLHRTGCASLKRLDARRRVAAEWGDAAGVAFPGDIEIVAAKRTGLLREVSDVFAREGIRIAGSRSVEENAGVRLRYTVEVENIGQLSRVLKLAREVRGVARAGRR